MDTPLSFGSWLRRRRKALGLTQQALAQRVYCAVVTLKKIEADARRPSPLLAEHLAAHLAIPIADRPMFCRVARGELSVDWLASLADSTPPLPTSLPLRRTAAAAPHIAHLFGRLEAIETLRAWLQLPERRLLTLVGPPGVGKTALGLHLAGLLNTTYRDGVRVVLLAAVPTPEQVLGALARAIGVSEQGRHPLHERVLLALRHQHTLVLVDNYEHVLSSAPLLGDIVMECPDVRILVTSREALRLRDEYVFAVTPLELPPMLADASPAAPDGVSLAAYPAIQLFVARAQAIQPAFTLTTDNASAIAAICHRLDGLPLAIELAVGWLTLLEPAALLAQLDHYGIGVTVQALGQQARDLPPRHQTLHQAIAWSYILLPEHEQRLFRILAVFAGGWTLEAVTTVAAEATSIRDTSTLQPLSVLAGLRALVAKNLVIRQGEVNSTERFSMLAYIHEYADERLLDDERAVLIQHCHAEYYRLLAVDAAAHLHGVDQRLWLDRLEDEHANIRRALAWLYQQGAATQLLQCTAALGPFWVTRGYLEEGRQWLVQALALGDAARSADHDRATAWLRLGDILLHRHERAAAHHAYESSLAAFTALDDHRGCAWARYGLRQLTPGADQEQMLYESLAAFRAVGDLVGQADVLNTLGSLARWQGRYTEAHALHTESLVCATAMGDSSQQAWAHALVGKVVANQGAYAAARAHYETSLALFRSVGNWFRLAWAMQGLGEVFLWDGDVQMASEVFTACLVRFRAMGDQNGIAWALYNQGRVAFEQGDLLGARRLLEDSVQRFQSIDDHDDSAWAFTVLGQVLMQSGDSAGAWTCYRESVSLHRRAGSQHGLVQSSEGVMALLADDSPTQAALLWGAAFTARSAYAIPIPAHERARVEHVVARMREQVGEEAFRAACREGQTQSFDTTVDAVWSYCMQRS